MRRLSIPILHRYILKQFFVSFLGNLFAFTSLFLVIDLFERMRIFLKEDSTFGQTSLYMLLKIPLVVHLMAPIAVLIATLMTLGKLSRLSEVTAMRASGRSLYWIASPLLGAGVVIALGMFLLGETVVPWSTRRVEEIYHLDIRKKAQEGTYSRENFWYRDQNRFYTIGFYDSRTATLRDVTMLEFNEAFELIRRFDADRAVYVSPAIGWSMRNIVEIVFDMGARVRMQKFERLPLVIKEKPEDFYNMQLKPESLSYRGLKTYIAKLRQEGVPVTSYEVNLASKLSFPWVNVIVVLLAVPFSLISGRSRTMTKSFIFGVAAGFSYHFIHALLTALGGAELIPVLPAAWAANILGLCCGIYLMSGAEFSKG